MDPQPYTLEDRKYAWDYFQLHSGQRMSTFNFYISLSTVIIAGIGTTLQNSINLPVVAALLGLLLILLSFVFWKLDQRNRNLIKNAENALKVLEKHFYNTGSADMKAMMLFSFDTFRTNQLRQKNAASFWKNYFSYADSFNVIFLAFSCIGIMSIVVASLSA